MAVVVLGLFSLLLIIGGFLPDRIFQYGDWVSYYLPLRMHLVEAWRSGDLLPLWWHGILGGFPAGANPQFGLFYPPHWVLLLIPIGPGLTLLTWAHLFWFGFGMWTLLRGRGVQEAPALLGGIICIGAGPVMSATSSVTLLMALAWLPWLLHWIPEGLKKEGFRARRLAAAALAAMLLTGGLEVLIWSLLIFPFWLLAVSGKGARTVLALSVAVGIAAAAVAAVQLLPALELIWHSTRTQGIDPMEAARFTATPGRLTGLLLPLVSWNPKTLTSWVTVTGIVRAHFLPALYLGAAVVALAVNGWRLAPRGDRIVMLGIALLSLLFGLGSGLPVIGSLAGLIPGGTLFRYPEKYLLIFVLSMAYMAAWGLQAVIERRGTGLLRIIGLAGLTAALAMWIGGETSAKILLQMNGLEVASFGSDALPSYLNSQVIWLAATSGISLAAGSLFLPAFRWRKSGRAPVYMVLLLVAAELTAGGRGFLRTTVLSQLLSRSGAATAIGHEGADGGRAARWSLSDYESAPLGVFTDPDRQIDLYREWMVPNLTTLQGVSTFDGSSALRVKPQARAEASWRLASEDTRILLGGALGIRYLLITDSDVAARISAHPAARTLYPAAPEGTPDTDTGPPLYVIENLVSLEPLQLVYDWLTASDDEEAFELLRSSGLMPNRQVVISPGPTSGIRSSPALPEPAGEGIIEPPPGSSIRILDRSDDRLTLEITTPRRALLVRSEYPYPGWNVSIDGRRERIYSANVVLQAVEIPAGTSEVTFHFRPTLYIWGGFITIFSLIWFAVPFFRRYILS